MASHDLASIVCQALGRGVARSKRRAMRWKRKAAESWDNGGPDACLKLAYSMYMDQPHAREVGQVGEAAGVAASAAASAGIMEGHDVPTDVLTDVVYWLQKGRHNLLHALKEFRGKVLEGGQYCHNEGCEVVGHRKDFKFCPQCKTAMYCGAACQKQDWNAGGHKEKCGTTAAQPDPANRMPAR